MVCRYCGLPTESDLGHTTETECIEALEREVSRLKAALKLTPSRDSVAGGASELPGHPAHGSESRP